MKKKAIYILTSRNTHQVVPQPATGLTFDMRPWQSNQKGAHARSQAQRRRVETLACSQVRKLSELERHLCFNFKPKNQLSN